MSQLTTEQQAALDQLRQITEGTDPDHELAVLASVNWNVEKALQMIFDDEPSPQAGPSTASAPVEQMEIDDSAQDTLLPQRPPRNAAPAYPISPRMGLGILSIITFPFTLITNILQFVFRILRVPFLGVTPYLFRRSPGSLRGPGGALRGGGTRGALAEDPASVADRFIRNLEDETGAMCVSHAAATPEQVNGASGASSSVAAGKTPISSKLLPDFFVGSYEQALKTAEKDLRVLCVILLSSEHDDVPEFNRNVLTDLDLVHVLTDNQFVVWGGDVRDREPYQASLKLGATTYPFVAFISLHPVPTHLGGPSSSHSGSGPRLTVLSRHEGPPTSNTSAQALHAHITTSLLPRVTPLLTRLRTERWNRAQERVLREEQDRAFQEAAARDRERVQQKQEEEVRAAAEERARIAAEQQRETLLEKRTLWRRYARKHLVPPEPAAGGLRIGVRLPDGGRAIRRFGAEDDAAALYTFVETLLISSEDLEGDSNSLPEGYSHEWSFALVTSFPRHEIPSSKVALTSINELKGGANLVVEMTGPTVDLEQGDSEGDDAEDE